MLIGVGAIWATLQGTYTLTRSTGLVFDNVTLLYGCLAALAVVLSNILLLECMARLPVSIASTVYRLNTIPLLLLAMLFLGEEPGAIRLFGVSVGLLSVFLLYSRVAGPIVGGAGNAAASHPDTSVVFSLWFSLIVVACILRALYGVLSKAGLSQGANANSMMLLAALLWFVGGLVYLLFDKNRAINSKACGLVFVAGVLVFSIVWLLTNALAIGDAVVVMPIANMGFVAAFVLAVLFGLEAITPRKLLAILTALVSVVLISAVD